VFTQVNVPIFSDMNAIPLFDRFEIEGSWRHDQYSDFGGTSNPKVAFNWTPSTAIGLTIRGSWGTSFRAPSFGELSPLTNTNIVCVNSTDPTCATQTLATGTSPVPGSGAYKVNPTGSTALNAPFGISHTGGSAAAVLAGLRAPGTTNAGLDVLKPEMSTNWSIGGEFNPEFLPGLNLQATWYKVKITNVLQSVGNPTSTSFNDPTAGFSFLVPSDFGCPVSSNAAPTSCAAFQTASLALLSNPRSALNPALSTLVYWINDGGVFNKGWLAVDGIDFSGSYDWDMGDIGAFNVGVVGTYYLNQLQQTTTGAPVLDTLYNTTINVGTLTMTGVESLPRFKYRARLGWANGPWSVTGFVNYESHYFHTQSLPPNVNSQCLTAGTGVPGGTLPCAITGYTNLEPSFYTFDLSLGYDTGDDPANDYLKHIGVQLVVQNLFGRRAPFEYRVSSGGGNPTAYDILKNDMGRTISVSVTKTW
jgi:iron complex outermembrane receptor protein